MSQEKKQKPRQKVTPTSTKSEQIDSKPARVYKRTDKKPFKSKYKEGYITPANYLAELIFTKRNEVFNSGKAPERFWLKGNKLHGSYKGQVIAASRLLKKYHVEAVSSAIQSPEAKYILKLQDKKLIPIIQKFESCRVEKEMEESYNDNREVSRPFRSKNRNILKGL